MAENGGFKHISVTAEDDEDVVIQAGVSPVAAAQDEIPQAEAAFEEEDAAAPEADALEQPAEEPSVETAVPQQPAQASRQVAPNAGTVRTRRREKEPYHETTLEDIESSKMSKTQVAVIVAAVILLIVGVFYYILFMR